jgi:ribulose 1,5-bisphosphate synthetase/thiazole synthase
MFAAAEHEVFEQVREPGFARPLVFRADVVPDVDGHDGRFVIFVNHQGEAVREDESLEGDIDILGEQRGEDECDQQQGCQAGGEIAAHRTSSEEGSTGEWGRMPSCVRPRGRPG